MKKINQKNTMKRSIFAIFTATMLLAGCKEAATKVVEKAQALDSVATEKLNQGMGKVQEKVRQEVAKVAEKALRQMVKQAEADLKKQVQDARIVDVKPVSPTQAKVTFEINGRRQVKTFSMGADGNWNILE